MDDNYGQAEALPDPLMSPVPRSPDARRTFRLARLLLLLDVAKSTGRKVATIDRLGYCEFLADSPFIVVDGDTKRDEGDRLALELAGFVRNQLSYASSGHRFASRRRRVQHDLSQLIALGLVTVARQGYEINEAGAAIAGNLRSVYADAYRVSAEIVLRRLSPLSNTALEESARQWLGESWLLVDLLDDVSEAIAPGYLEERRNNAVDLQKSKDHR
jgi:hypothetical protein